MIDDHSPVRSGRSQSKPSRLIQYGLWPSAVDASRNLKIMLSA